MYSMCVCQKNENKTKTPFHCLGKSDLAGNTKR